MQVRGLHGGVECLCGCKGWVLAAANSLIICVIGFRTLAAKAFPVLPDYCDTGYLSASLHRDNATRTTSGANMTAWLQAQQYPPDTSKQTGSSQNKVEGCLQGSDGNFTLSDSSGTTYQLQGDTAKLSEHVGHEVQITGSTSGG